MPTPLPWHQIDTVLLDMDGTLIDLHFDSHLWQQLVPERYAARLGLPLADAKAKARLEDVTNANQIRKDGADARADADARARGDGLRQDDGWRRKD